jgi:hypothetical protein
MIFKTRNEPVNSVRNQWICSSFHNGVHPLA